VRAINGIIIRLFRMVNQSSFWKQHRNQVSCFFWTVDRC